MIESPCIKVCVINADSKLCEGCGRSLEEIARWSSFTDAKRRAIMQRLDTRKPQQGNTEDKRT